MLTPPPSRLLQQLRRLGQAGPDDSDAMLLQRFVESRDESAFEELLRRHAAMVLRVCRRHLGGPDADDAFQAVFLVLARDAGRIARREAPAGWLFRVAYHVSRKLMAQNARRRFLSIRDEDCPRPDESRVERGELRAAVEQEVNALPDKFRSAVVLCYLEGRTTSEAAQLLGCPKGTIDSRLSIARRKLRARLLRRGVAVTGGGAIETLWASDGCAAGPDLIRRTLDAAIVFARTGSAAGAVSRDILNLVAGVSPTMSTHRLTLILAAAVLLTTMGGAGVTVFYAGADGTKPAATPEKEKDKPPRAEAPPAERDRPKTEASNETVQGMLRQPLAADKDLPPTLSLKEFLEFLRDRFNVPIRIDLAAFARMGYPEAVQLYDSQVKLPVVRGMTLADGLRDVLAQLSANGGGEGGGAASHGATFRIRNGQILIIPAYRLSGRSVGGPPPNGEDEVIVPANVLLEQLEGEPISLSVDEKPFAEVLRELRQTTGANIVLDAREKDKAKLAVSATLNDVRLMAALRVLGDMCDLQPVSLNNVFYVTSKENAEKLQREIDRRRYGDPQPSLGGLGGAPANPPPMSTPPSKPKSP